MAGCRWVCKQKECKLLSKIEKKNNNLAKKQTNKGVWYVLVKGLRLKAETTIGTETTRWVS